MAVAPTRRAYELPGITILHFRDERCIRAMVVGGHACVIGAARRGAAPAGGVTRGARPAPWE
jgi:hypothetical protein